MAMTIGPLPLIGKLLQGSPMGIGYAHRRTMLSTIIPFISSVMRDVFGVVPRCSAESAYGLGATTKVMRGVVLPYTKTGVIGGVWPGRALGETMAVTFVIPATHTISIFYCSCLQQHRLVAGQRIHRSRRWAVYLVADRTQPDPVRDYIHRAFAVEVAAVATFPSEGKHSKRRNERIVYPPQTGQLLQPGHVLHDRGDRSVLPFLDSVHTVPARVAGKSNRCR